METFHATKYTDQLIELASSSNLSDLFSLIEREENFILTWKEGSVTRSKVIIGSDLHSKVKGGDLELTAMEGKK